MYKSLDLFCGAGGFSLGLESTNQIETIFALDYNKNAIETFSNNFKKATTFCEDITNKEIKNKILEIIMKEKIDIIIGGPPCQGFSLKGKKLGLEDPRNFLFLEYLYFVEHIKPKVFVIENVKNLITSNNGYFIKQIEEKFKKIGYSISYKILNAHDYGVPQKRERAIIIGILEAKFKPIFPTKTKEKQTVRDAISDLNYLNSGEGLINQSYKNKPLSKYQETKKNKETILNWHIATNHSDKAIYKMSLIPAEKGKEYLPKEYWGNQKFNTTWSRLVWDLPSGTIDTRFDTPSNGRNIHPELNRAITPREAARLQGFPDNFHFFGNKTAVCKQIGNAVPVDLGKAIGFAIIENIEKMKKD